MHLQWFAFRPCKGVPLIELYGETGVVLALANQVTMSLTVSRVLSIARTDHLESRIVDVHYNDPVLSLTLI